MLFTQFWVRDGRIKRINWDVAFLYDYLRTANKSYRPQARILVGEFDPKSRRAVKNVVKLDSLRRKGRANSRLLWQSVGNVYRWLVIYCVSAGFIDAILMLSADW